MSYKHYQDGEWKDQRDILVSGFSLGFSRGLSAFETVRTYNGEPFALKEHLARLSQALEALDIAGYNMSVSELRETIVKGMQRNNMSEAVVKIIVASGDNEGMLTSSKSSLMLQFFDLKLPNIETYQNGAKLITM